MTGRVLYVALHALDHQIVDRQGTMVGKVDDAELRVTEDGAATMVALLSGPGVLATRLGRHTYGAWREHVEASIDGPGGRTTRIPLHLVQRLGSTVEVALEAPQLATFGSERWVGDHIVSHVPGSRWRPDDAVPSPTDDLAGRHLEPAPPEGRGDSGGALHVRASALLRRVVHLDDGRPFGHVLDVRLVQDGPIGSGFSSALRVDGLVVGHGRGAQRAGLFRHRVHGPLLLRTAAKILGPARRYAEWALLSSTPDLTSDAPIIIAERDLRTPPEDN